jgi:hypothetical protein
MSIKENVQRRGNHLSRIRRMESFFSGKDDFDLRVVWDRKDRLILIQEDIESIQDTIELLVLESELGAQRKIREDFFKRIEILLDKMSMFNDTTRRRDSQLSSTKTQEAEGKVKLATLTIPTFYGDYKGWSEF